MARVIVLTLIVLSCLVAQNDPTRFATSGYANGRGWDQMRAAGRIFYVKGFLEGIAVVRDELNVERQINERSLGIATGFLIDDYVKEIDRVYSDRENIRIPIAMLIPTCTKKFTGKLTKDQAEGELSRFREWARQH